MAQLCLTEFRKRIVEKLESLGLSHLIKNGEFVLFPLLSCLGNLIGKGKERDVLVALIQKDYKIESMISITPVNEIRYLSHCNLAEIFVNYEKSVNFFLKKLVLKINTCRYYFVCSRQHIEG